MRGGVLTWGPLDGDGDREAVAALAGRCHGADGGVPEVTISRFAADGVITTGGRTATGVLVAAAAVRPLSPGVALIGLVDPAHRGAGVGGALLDWGLATATSVVAGVTRNAATSAATSAVGSVAGSTVGGVTGSVAISVAGGAAGGAAGGVTVETEALTGAAERLFASRGLRQVFAEDVMRFDLAAAEPPVLPLPPGLTALEWTPARAPRFFAAYDAAFRERPGFPAWPVERWVAWTAGDEEFRPQWSLLAAGPAGDAAGLEGDTAGLEGDAAGLEGDTAGLEGDAAGLEGDTAGLEGD
ncbi:GNAT family N-acetyltransferase, partial [Phytohabitans suffuscus]